MSLDSAILQIEQEVSQLNQRLVAGKRPDGSPEWWLLRAKSTALSLLKTMKTRGLTDIDSAEAYRRSVREYLNLSIELSVDPVIPPAEAPSVVESVSP